MDIAKIIVISVVGAFFSLILKEQKAYLGATVAICTTCIILFFILPELERFLSFIKRLFLSYVGDDLYLGVLLKIVGITCICKLGEDILKDAGLNAAASSVVMTGRVICATICIPVISVLFDTVLSVLPT